VSVTWVTFADAAVASGEVAWDVITDANCDPFCSSAIRCATGVLALKNFAQLVSIAAVAAAPEVGSDEPVGAELELGLGLGLEELDCFGGVLDELELLHPASARPAVSNIAVDMSPALRRCIGCIAALCRRTGSVKSCGG
jgi:hypothetical protein